MCATFQLFAKTPPPQQNELNIIIIFIIITRYFDHRRGYDNVVGYRIYTKLHIGGRYTVRILYGYRMHLNPSQSADFTDVI